MALRTMKPLEEMCMLDRFLFAEAMEEPWIHEYVLGTIFQEEIKLQWPLITEKEIRNHPENRSIRLDGWVKDLRGRAYNTEVQRTNTGNLPRRSRLYQGTIDRTLLLKGVKDFNQLPDCFLVMIMPFDLLGRKKYRYTFQLCCRETGQLLEDGAVRIFLNTRGEDREGISQELAELLEYMENGKLYETSSEKLRELHQKIERIKKDKETGVRYMQAWEELEMMREEGIKEGEARGLKAGVSIMLRLCADLGIEKSQILGYIKNTDALPDGAKSQMEEVLGKARE
ncbi:MAG TPA: Rpn family recombination-promoting nuclease/putative transposase [Candidatus Egerieimonas intestinavium]|uniref:Rpn family recombination-promoting nuclease/putative transposase n=1 Tax=Candidatus Egerieimonas intestinavium TaxID=2840777 RepID=A0A9D1EK43_9FIRM|nr:Rpn family recombination-promoting nuclease/putative transposase [Candidatus Egerieimonas intestinavium]